MSSSSYLARVRLTSRYSFILILVPSSCCYPAEFTSSNWLLHILVFSSLYHTIVWKMWPNFQHPTTHSLTYHIGIPRVSTANNLITVLTPRGHTTTSTNTNHPTSTEPTTDQGNDSTHRWSCHHHQEIDKLRGWCQVCKKKHKSTFKSVFKNISSVCQNVQKFQKSENPLLSSKLHYPPKNGFKAFPQKHT